MVIGVFSLLVSVILGVPLYAALAIGVAGFLGLPRWFVNRLRKCRFKKFMDEFPNAVDIIVRGVKAGLPLNDCVRMIAVESAEPVRGEFRVVSEAQSVGLSLSEAVE